MAPRIALAVTLLAAALPSFADDRNPQPVQTATTQRIDFAPGGLIRLNDSYGDLFVSAWDQPQVELTVTKSLPLLGDSAHPERARQRLEEVNVAAEKRSATELVVSTIRRKRAGRVMLKYEIRVPRTSRLAMHHGAGFVLVDGVTGNIEATCRRGDIVLMLPQDGQYGIDAKSKFGAVTSDFAGVTKLARYRMGERFSAEKPLPASRLYLRVGLGGIAIKPIPPAPSTP